MSVWRIKTNTQFPIWEWTNSFSSWSLPASRNSTRWHGKSYAAMLVPSSRLPMALQNPLLKLNPTDITIDRENAFLLYATFCGDLEKTAHALNVQPVDVLEMARADRWDERLKSILALKKSSRPGDIERAINRAVNFVQAHRLRHVVERAIRRLYQMTDAEFEKAVFTNVSIKGEVDHRLSAKGLADLASAMEKAQSMSYAALTDTATDRARRKAEEDTEASAASLHVQIAQAMTKVGESGSVSAQLFDKQLEQAQHLLQERNAEPTSSP